MSAIYDRTATNNTATGEVVYMIEHDDDATQFYCVQHAPRDSTSVSEDQAQVFYQFESIDICCEVCDILLFDCA